MSRVLLLEADQAHDVFEVVSLTEGLARVCTPFLYDVGEELRVRIDDAGKVTDMFARVRGHVGGAEGKVTELELTPTDESRA